MAALVRSLVYATLFISLVLVFVPARLLEWSGVTRPAEFGAALLAGNVLVAAGATLVLMCILTFAFKGRGTPALFDPPRKLVVRGPYRLVRNPMYIGAGVALLGAALRYRSAALLAYAAIFLVAMHLFVVGYEEPTLRRTFGADYEEYCRRGEGLRRRGVSRAAPTRASRTRARARRPRPRPR